MRAGWDAFVDYLGLGETAVVSVFVICVGALCCQCFVAVYRGAREKHIARAWARPTRVCSPRREARGRWGRLIPGPGRSARHRGRAQGPPTPRELSLLVAEVATRLRAGAPTSLAWGLALARIDAGGSVGVDDSYPAVLDAWARAPTRWRFLRRVERAPGAAASRVSAASVALACRFSHDLGAPLADVLDAIGSAIDDAQALEEARRVAAAGPLMSARVLAALPLVGVVAALALGASPWQFYTGGGAGRMCAFVGVAAWGGGCRLVPPDPRSVQARRGGDRRRARLRPCRLRPGLWRGDPPRSRCVGRCLRLPETVVGRRLAAARGDLGGRLGGCARVEPSPARCA